MKLIDAVKSMLEKKCEGCSCLHGSMGQSSPCSYCNRGDLNSSKYPDEEEYWDLLSAKMAGVAL